MAVKLRPVPPPAPDWWDSLAAIITFSRRQSRDFWVALSTSPDPRLRALVFRCNQHEEYLTSQRLDPFVDGHRLTSFLSTTWTPHIMCVALETLHREGRLSRRECTVLQEKFFVRTSPEGRWTFPQKESR